MIDYQEALGFQEDQNRLLVLGLQVCLLHPREENETIKVKIRLQVLQWDSEYLELEVMLWYNGRWYLEVISFWLICQRKGTL